MSLQILDIVLYSHDGRQRVLSLRAGSLNVITGASKTGKSALIDIIDYCFGSGECGVPEGPIRRSVAWFGLRLALKNGQAFIARRCPDSRAKSSQDCFIKVADSIVVPAASDIVQTTNVEGLQALLASWSGIQDTLHVPTIGQTRPPLAASIRHALAFCLQPQDEINRRHQLFHGAADNFVALGLRDTLPYFLGAVGDDYVRRREELRRLKDDLRQCERRLSELTAIRGDGASKVADLLAEARDAGLTVAMADSWESSVLCLREVGMTVLSQTVATNAPDESEFERLSRARASFLQQLGRVREEISAVKAYERDEQGFAREAKEQHARLRTIGIFEGLDPNKDCPLCRREMPESGGGPAITEVASTLDSLRSRLQAVSREEPHVQRVIAELEAKAQDIQRNLGKNRAEMEAVRATDNRVAGMLDSNARKSHVIGRISLYLESLPELPGTSDLEERAQDLRGRIAILEQELSDEVIADRLNSIGFIIGRWMTEWANHLHLEYCEPLRLDAKKLTIVADTAEHGPVSLARMGSGENWVGYHIIAHLALHKWFAERDRPVPRFLFLDQPSQVYFPEESELDGPMEGTAEDDRMLVSRMFKLVFDLVAELAPGLQVIMTEHANQKDEWFQDSIIERWRGGLKLVPEDWPRVS